MKLRVTIDDQSFEVEVGDLNARPILATVDGETFEVWPEENGKSSQAVAQNAIPLPGSRAPGATAPAVMTPNTIADITAEAKTKVVLAPIPGVIIAVSVKAGDSVSFGQELCVLEAMKMKNMIRATRSGKIGAIHVTAGDQVKHSQVLIEYTD